MKTSIIKGIAPSELAKHYPRLFHMAEPGSWPGIQRHGLLSTSALLDRFAVKGARRVELEAQHRPESVTITHAVHGTAVIRDQKPMHDNGLKKVLPTGMTPADWYRILNKRVFFWVSAHRLERLLNARAYRNRRQTVLTLDTALLLDRHHARVTLSPINSGCTKPYPQPRGPDTFLPLPSYPFASWMEKRRSVAEAVVELAVDYSVPDVCDFILRVEEREPGKPTVVLWKR